MLQLLYKILLFPVHQTLTSSTIPLSIFMNLITLDILCKYNHTVFVPLWLLASQSIMPPRFTHACDQISLYALVNVASFHFLGMNTLLGTLFFNNIFTIGDRLYYLLYLA